jgi:hypothetical protein
MSLLEEQALSAKEELSKFREEQFVSRAMNRIEDMNKTNGVTPEVAALYEAQLDRAYREGKIRNMEDLEKVYKSVHEPFSKMLSERERSVIEKYTSAKKNDASKPASQPKGKAPTQGSPDFSKMSQQEVRQHMVKTVTAQLRAGRDV